MTVWHLQKSARLSFYTVNFKEKLTFLKKSFCKSHTTSSAIKRATHAIWCYGIRWCGCQPISCPHTHTHIRTQEGGIENFFCCSTEILLAMTDDDGNPRIAAMEWGTFKHTLTCETDLSKNCFQKKFNQRFVSKSGRFSGTKKLVIGFTSIFDLQTSGNPSTDPDSVFINDKGDFKVNCLFKKKKSEGRIETSGRTKTKGCMQGLQNGQVLLHMYVYISYICIYIVYMYTYRIYVYISYICMYVVYMYS